MNISKKVLKKEKSIHFNKIKFKVLRLYPYTRVFIINVSDCFTAF